MNVLSILNSPWAILPDRLAKIQQIYLNRSEDLAERIARAEASLGRELENNQPSYLVTNGVAEVFLHGVVAKRMNMFHQISGGCSSQLVGRDLNAALQDPTVSSIVLHIDSPGGTVDGTQSLSDLVFQARQRKTVVALASGMMCSAAYWIGSAASAVYIEEETTNVGSIGVVASHIDISRAEQREGITTTEIVAGRFKRVASQYAPLSDAGRAVLQDQVDYLYSIFVANVARNRETSVDAVLNGMADGRVFIGSQAIDAGLVDGIVTRGQLLNRLAQGGIQ